MPKPPADKTFCTGVFKETPCPIRQHCARYIYNYTEPQEAWAWYFNNAPFYYRPDGHADCDQLIPNT